MISAESPQTATVKRWEGEVFAKSQETCLHKTYLPPGLGWFTQLTARMDALSFLLFLVCISPGHSPGLLVWLKGIDPVSFSVKKIAQVGLLLALSYLGSLVKIPTPVGSTAFDSAPAYFAGLLLGGTWGGLVGLIGHLFTALVSGFPLSLPIHLVIAAGMGISVWLFAKLWSRSQVLAYLVALLTNGLLLPLCLVIWPPFTVQTIMVTMVPYLLLATLFNLLVVTGLWATWGSRYGQAS